MARGAPPGGTRGRLPGAMSASAILITFPSSPLSPPIVSTAVISYMTVNIKEAVAGMSAQPRARQRRRRADAEQNVTAILDAATRALSAQPEASVEDIARSAGLSRQTVYAHFPSREALLDAVVERATAETAAAFEAAGLEDAPPAEALIRLLDAGWAVATRYPFLWHLPAACPGNDLARH